MAGKPADKGKPKVSPEKAKANARAEAHAKAFGKQERATTLLNGRELRQVSTNGVRAIANELDIPGADTLPRADVEVAIRTILGVEAEGKPE